MAAVLPLYDARTSSRWGACSSSKYSVHAFVGAAFVFAACLLFFEVMRMNGVILSTVPMTKPTSQDDAVAVSRDTAATRTAGASAEVSLEPLQRSPVEEHRPSLQQEAGELSQGIQQESGAQRLRSESGVLSMRKPPEVTVPVTPSAESGWRQESHAPDGPVSKTDRASGFSTTDGRVNLVPVRRIDNISSSEFQFRYGEQYGLAPLVVTNSQSDWHSEELFDREHLRRYIGDMAVRYNTTECETDRALRDSSRCHRIMERRSELAGAEWAALSAVNLTELNVTTYSDFLDAQRAEAQKGRYIYAFDMAVMDFPKVAELIRIPKYFLDHYHDISADPDEIPEHAGSWTHFPSIFFGEAGSGSPLHSDSLMTRFWVVALTGRKHLRVIPPFENWRIHPTDGDDMQPSIFKADLFDPHLVDEFPDAAGMLVYDAVLEPGDLMFIPDGWPHQAKNLDWSLMVTMNVIDSNNADNYLRARWYENEGVRDLEYLKEVQQDSQFFFPIHDPHDQHENMPLRTFHEHLLLERAPVSKAARTFVHDLKDRGVPPGEWRDRFSVPLLWATANANYVKLASWLLLHGAPVNTVNPALGTTPLDVAESRGYRKLATVLRQAGGKRSSPLHVRGGE